MVFDANHIFAFLHYLFECVLTKWCLEKKNNLINVSALSPTDTTAVLLLWTLLLYKPEKIFFFNIKSEVNIKVYRYGGLKHCWISDRPNQFIIQSVISKRVSRERERERMRQRKGKNKRPYHEFLLKYLAADIFDKRHSSFN